MKLKNENKIFEEKFKNLESMIESNCLLIFFNFYLIEIQI